MVEQIVLIVLLINAFSIVLIVALVYIVDFRPYLKHISRMRANVDEQSAEILKQAKILGEQIVKEANGRSEVAKEENLKLLKILEEKINYSVEETISKSKESIQSTTLSSIKLYKEQLDSLTREYISYLNSSKEEINQQAKLGLNNFLTAITKSVDDVNKGSQDKVNLAIEQTKEELNKQKEEKLKEVDDHIFEMLQQVTKKVVGRSIDMSEHEKIVFEALEKAKREGDLLNG